MKKIVKVIGLVVTGITAVEMIQQDKRNARYITEAHNRINELLDQEWATRNKEIDLRHDINMLKIDMEHEKRMKKHQDAMKKHQDARVYELEKDLRKANDRIFDLEMDHITTKSQMKYAARKSGIEKPDFYTDRRKEEKAQQAESQQKPEKITAVFADAN